MVIIDVKHVLKRIRDWQESQSRSRGYYPSIRSENERIAGKSRRERNIGNGGDVSAVEAAEEGLRRDDDLAPIRVKEEPRLVNLPKDTPFHLDSEKKILNPVVLDSPRSYFFTNTTCDQNNHAVYVGRYGKMVVCIRCQKFWENYEKYREYKLERRREQYRRSKRNAKLKKAEQGKRISTL